MTRKIYIAGNWKMHTRREDAVALARDVAEQTRGAAADVAVCVPFPHLAPVQQALSGTHVALGAQDVYWEPQGAYTGEVSTTMLEDYCGVVIIGHSERRALFGDTDDWVNRKLKAVLASSLDPIVCIGETLEQRQAGETETVLARQIAGALEDVDASARITFAYEPVWAIGTGETASSEVAQEACAFVRSRLVQHAGQTAGAEIRIQYGGSVKPDNAAELLSQPDIDGALVGGAALDAGQFAAIVAAAPQES